VVEPRHAAGTNIVSVAVKVLCKHFADRGAVLVVLARGSGA
jgi:hypothetical protein